MFFAIHVYKSTAGVYKERHILYFFHTKNILLTNWYLKDRDGMFEFPVPPTAVTSAGIARQHVDQSHASIIYIYITVVPVI